MPLARLCRGGRGAVLALLLALSPAGCAIPAIAEDGCVTIDQAQERMAEAGYRHVATVTGPALAGALAMYRARAAWPRRLWPAVQRQILGEPA